MAKKRPRLPAEALPEPRSHCPVACALDIVGDKWTLVIIRDLFHGKSKYSEFLAADEGIQPAVLSDRIKRLETCGLIERRLYSEHPPRAEYLLTDLGRTLQPIVAAVGAWGLAHIEGTKPAT